MLPYKLIFPIFFIALAISCNNDYSNDLSFKTNTTKNVISKTEVLQLSIENKKNHLIDSVTYKINDQMMGPEVELNDFKLGKTKLQATVYIDSEPVLLTKEITILNHVPPKVYTFNIINEYPHDIESYTQGLEFFNGDLYESTGQYGKSKLRKVDYKTGEAIKSIDLERQYFGEGLTIINKKIHQLTWRENMGFTYNLETFEKESTFNYDQSKEGWGICNDGKVIYKSDGTEKIWMLDPETLVEKGYIQAYHNKGKTVGLNELEWIDGRIYANRYQLNGVAIINPENGAIEGVIDFSSLRKKVRQHPKLDVLNGLAYNPETKTLFVTGKYWNKLFEVEIIEK